MSVSNVSLTLEQDPYESDEYAAFVESMIPLCHCVGHRPCDGVLAGGICDDIQDDGREELGDQDDFRSWDNDEGDK